MPEIKKPQDHLPKSEPFTFESGGKTYALPPASRGAESISGRELRDAAMDGDEGQLRLGFLMLEACGVDDETLDAVYSLTAAKTLETIQSWMLHDDGQEVALPK